MTTRSVPNSSHWGAFTVTTDADEIVAVSPHPLDPDPSPLLGNIASAARHQSRVARPSIRRGWLDAVRAGDPDRQRQHRGDDEFVEVSWDEALDLAATELDRVRGEHGNEAIYGGSYGWASAGRFHHAQSQIHRFLNCAGGYVRSVNTYSTGCSSVVLPHIVGGVDEIIFRPTTWPAIIEHTDLVVAFGGIPAKNVHVVPGGMTRHTTADQLRAAAASGTRFALVSPLRADLADGLPAEWHPIEPGTDVAMMLALTHTLFAEGLADREFLGRYTVGADVLEEYLFGRGDDGIVKDADWAAAITGIDAATIVDLARRMAGGRTLVTVSWSLQRSRFGEQPVWAGIALAAALGQIGLPGGGFGHGHGSMGDIGSARPQYPLPRFGQGSNPVSAFIPVARVADMLLAPGEPFEYDGGHYEYPDIRLVYWAGGNPFHHHQDLHRLREAFRRPDTVIVHEPFWTPMARHADIVFPATLTIERDDLGAGHRDTHLIAMHRAVEPYGDARDDYEILSGLATRLGFAAEFTDGRTANEWIELIYDEWRTTSGVAAPPFEQFWADGGVELPGADEQTTSFSRFRSDPDGAPLPTPSGRIELFSSTVAGFGYDDCPGHPAWLGSGAGDADDTSFVLVSNQPTTRLHSQLDPGDTSVAGKIDGREPMRIHPDDAAARGIADGDVVRLYNERGACLAGAVISDAVRPGVVQLPTGAWFDPVVLADGTAACAHGNPNVLTVDVGTSRLAQGCSGQLTRVEVVREPTTPPPVRAHVPPALVVPTGDPSTGEYVRG